MKNLPMMIAALLLTACFASSSTLAASNNSSYSFKKLSQKLCESAATDHLFLLRHDVRKARTHIRTIYPEVVCDGQSLLSVALANESEAVSNYLKLRAKPESIRETDHLVSAK
jgi:hypothetical protein